MADKPNVLTMSEDELAAFFGGMTPQQVIKFVKDTKKELSDLAKSGSDQAKEEFAQRKKILALVEDQYNIQEDSKDLAMEIMQMEEQASNIAKTSADQAKALGDNIKSTVEAIPVVGEGLSSFFNLDELGQIIQKRVLGGFEGLTSMIRGPGTTAAFTFNTALTAGIGALVALILLAVAAIAGMAIKVRDLAKELGTSMSQAKDLVKETTLAGIALTGTGQDAEAIAGELIDTFGTLNSVQADNIRDIGFLATRFGAASKDIITFQKSLTDTFGVSVDQSEQIIRNVGKLAQAEGVAAGKVIADIAANTEKFAEFAKGGADGFALAAVEAAKIGTNLSAVLGAADKLLEFESSLTAEFEAQVITGKSFNLERARQLALNNEIGALAQELATQVGSLGDIEAMNVLERRSLAEAIGVSTNDLMKIARGEQVAEQETVQDKIDQTNKILIAGFDEDKEKMDELISTTAANSPATIYE
tara:strand:- start:83 stop:1507 length:1425 start_codon:yes stop_codon:yes gene_type:complete